LLLLTRKRGQKLLIGNDIVITFNGIGSHGEHQVGISAPKDVRIMRSEIAYRFQDECHEAANKNREELSTKSVENAVDKACGTPVEYAKSTDETKGKNPDIKYKPRLKRWESLSSELGLKPE